jgi:hypothetical protein
MGLMVWWLRGRSRGEDFGEWLGSGKHMDAMRMTDRPFLVCKCQVSGEAVLPQYISDIGWNT